MFELKNLKILFTLLLFVCVSQNAWGGLSDYSWFHFTVNVKAKVKNVDGTLTDYYDAGNVYAKLAKNSNEQQDKDELHSHPDGLFGMGTDVQSIGQKKMVQ